MPRQPHPPRPAPATQAAATFPTDPSAWPWPASDADLGPGGIYDQNDATGKARYEQRLDQAHRDAGQFDSIDAARRTASDWMGYVGVIDRTIREWAPPGDPVNPADGALLDLLAERNEIAEKYGLPTRALDDYGLNLQAPTMTGGGTGPRRP